MSMTTAQLAAVSFGPVLRTHPRPVRQPAAAVRLVRNHALDPPVGIQSAGAVEVASQGFTPVKDWDDYGEVITHPPRRLSLRRLEEFDEVSVGVGEQYLLASGACDHVAAER
jgi:hypothetical protein